MKDNNRQAWVLAFLLLFLLGYGFYVLLLTPRIEENQELEMQIAADDVVVRSMYGTIAGYETKRQAFLENVERISALSERFYSDSEQEQYLDALSAMLEQCGLTLVNLTALEHIPLEVDTEGYRCEDPFEVYAAEGTESNPGKQELPLPLIEIMELRLEATGKYSGVKKMLKQMEGYEKIILCHELSVEMTAESMEASMPDPEVRAALTLSFLRIDALYALPPGAAMGKENFAYVPPQEFLSGAYRDMFSPQNWVALIQEHIPY